MSKYSIELVPRDFQQLENDIKTIDSFPHFEFINIPDLKRFNIRSWESAQLVKKYNYTFIPHFRAIDFNVEKPEKIFKIIEENELEKVLIISGDPPQDMSYEVFPTSSISLCKIIKKDFPKIKIYGALDPYRSSIKDEMDYLDKKKDCGFDGFFSQPFFDLRLLEIFLENYEDDEIYWGISPVTSIRSKNYWETRNRASFPKEFTPSFEWNVNFAKKAIEYLDKKKHQLYFMPIKIDMEKYLKCIFY